MHSAQGPLVPVGADFANGADSALPMNTRALSLIGIAQWSCWLISFIGALVLIGWVSGLFEIPWFSYKSSTLLNTGLVMLLAGAGVAFACRGWFRLSFWVGLLVSSLGVVHGFDYLSNVDFSLQQAFLSDPNANLQAPGRLSPHAVLCTLTLGLSLLLFSKARKSLLALYVAGALIGVSLSVSLTAVVGHLGAIRIANTLIDYSGMAVHTGIGFSVLGLCLLVAIRSSGMRDSTARFIACFLSIAVTLTGLNLWFWMALRGHVDESLREQSRAQVQWISDELEDHFGALSDGIELFATRLANLNVIDYIDWEQAATRYVNQIPEIKAMLLLSPESEILSVAVNRSVEDPIDVSGFSEQFGQFQNIEASVDSIAVAMADDPRPGAPWSHIAVLVPDLPPPYGQGHTVGLINVQDVVQFLSSRNHSRILSVRMSPVYDGERSAISLQRKTTPDTIWFETHTNVLGIPALLEVQSSLERSSSQYSLINLIILSGIVMSAAVLAAMALLRRSRVLSRLAQDGEQRWHQVVDAAPNAMMLVNQDGVVQMANVHCESLFGYGPDELLGMTVEALMPAAWRDKYKSAMTHYWRAPQVRDVGAGGIFPALRKDAIEVPVEIGVSPMRTDHGVKILASIVDVSEREQYISELSRSNEELDRFAYVASHDLKSPLRGLDQLASWLTEDLGSALSADSARHLRLMRSRVTRMEKLLDDLLAYSRVGRMKRDLESVSIEVLLQGVIDLHVTDTRYKVEIVGEMPVIDTAIVPLQLVFRNLIGNAIKHHDKPSGRITISAKTLKSGVEFDVADDGPGIAPEYRGRVFELFSTLNRRDEKEGSGLGLAIVLRTIESLGGTISLHGREPRGTIVRFLWPARHKA